MKMYQKIRNCKSKKMSIRQTAGRLELSRKTVSKYYKMDDITYLKYLVSTETKDKRFDSFKDEIPSKLDSWLIRRANGKICQATGIVPSGLLEEERKSLLLIS